MIVPKRINKYSHIALLKKIAQAAETATITTEKALKKPVPQISHPKTSQQKPSAQRKFEKMGSFEDIAIKYANFLNKVGSSILPTLNINIDNEMKKEAIKWWPWMKRLGLLGAGYYLGYRSAKSKYGPQPPPEMANPVESGYFLTPEMEYGGMK
jgi:hypothetical protein